MSLYTRTISITTGTTGLAPTMGVTVYDNSGNILVTRLTLNIVESPEFTYTIQIQNFDSTWYGNVVWDNNGTLIESIPFTGVNVDVPFINVTSYLTVEQANDYFSTRLNSDAWSNSIVADQQAALCQASRSIDTLNYIGIKASHLQQTQWPRIIKPRRIGQYYGGITPNNILYAVCEIALKLLDGVDPELEDELLGSASSAYATVRITTDSKVARDHIKAGIVSVTAWNLLLPYLQDPRTILLRKV